MGKIFHAFMTDGGRQFVGDEKLLTSVSGAPTRGQPARRTRIATYYGSSFLAERGEYGDLHIYHVGTGVLPSDVIGDRAAPCGCGTSLNEGRMTAAKMQARNVELRKQASGR